VFYQGGSLERVLLHAVIVVVETSFLAIFATVLAHMFTAHAASLEIAREATGRERELRERDEEAGRQMRQRAAEIQQSVRTFRDRMESTLSVLDHSTDAMQGGSRIFTGTTDEVRKQSGAVATAADTMFRGLDRLGAASTELATSIGEIGRNGALSAERSKRVADLARSASDELGQLVVGSDDAGAVVEIIRGIAAQTSMLALNATIEAARAGEMGRGFAVVASEVKSLAAQTAAATDDVSRQIAAMQRTTERSVRAIRDIVASIGEVEHGAEAIALAVQAQGHASIEIAEQLQFLSESARRSTDVVENFEGMTVRTHGAAEQLQEAADTLAEQARSLRGEVETFCARVAAA
jgi:methyl-accepting chemotaxis protein